MGRQLKRVALDFDWPMNMIWKGYINPYRSMECKACDGRGLGPEEQSIAEGFYTSSRFGGYWSDKITQDEVQALVNEDRLKDFTHKYVSGTGWVKKEPFYIPTAEEVNAWARKGMGHDSVNRMILVETRCKRLLGKYDQCKYCQGEGIVWQSDEIKKLSEEWKSFDPPAGEGFQLYENTSEGSPVSPVFKTLDELCEWCQDNATTFGSFKTTKEEWKKMLDEDHVYYQKGNMVFI